MQRISLKIEGMDCAEEERILKNVLIPLLKGTAKLEFEVLKGRLTIQSENEIELTPVMEAISKTGMKGIPWEEAISFGNNEDTPFFKKHLRSILLTGTIFLILLGFIVHLLSSSFAEAIGYADSILYPIPTPTLILYILAIVISGWHVGIRGWRALLRLRPDMNMLMSIAIIGAMILGEWLEAASVAVLFNFALILESWSVGRARRAVESLLSLAPLQANLILAESEQVVVVHPSEVSQGSRIRVRPGERIPLDGIVTGGNSFVNQAPITGESNPISKEIDDEVYAGTINGEGVLDIETTRSSDDTVLSHIIKLVDDASANRGKREQWVESFAAVYTPLMLILAGLIAVIPPLLLHADWSIWIYQALVILVIGCPCALVISTPVSIVAGISSAARKGILIKGGAYLELPAKVNIIAFDKTGTLTKGKLEVSQITPTTNLTADNLLQLAASLESSSSHPIASAIVDMAQSRGVEFLPVSDVQQEGGLGVQGVVNKEKTFVGNDKFIKKILPSLALPENDQMGIIVHIFNEEEYFGKMILADTIREETQETFAELRKVGVQQLVILSGDNTENVERISKDAEASDFYAELLPEQKVEKIKELKLKYGVLGMVGDGINDTPAMAAADFGIAMGAVGTDAAIETADIALMTDDLRGIPRLIKHSRRTLSVIKQNVIFALGLKLLFLLLALLGVATLWMAVMADMGASLLVIFNSLRLLRMRI